MTNSSNDIFKIYFKSIPKKWDAFLFHCFLWLSLFDLLGDIYVSNTAQSIYASIEKDIMHIADIFVVQYNIKYNLLVLFPLHKNSWIYILRVNDSTPPWKSHKIRFPGKLCGILVFRFFGLLKSEIV